MYILVPIVECWPIIFVGTLLDAFMHHAAADYNVRGLDWETKRQLTIHINQMEKVLTC